MRTSLEAAYERLERLGRPLNAVASVVPVLPGGALPGGALPGGALPGGALPGGALSGRPVAVKDIIAVAGVRTGCGSPASDPGPARRDATVVRRLRAAGAAVFATSQCLEYAAGFAHPDIGGTRNPHDPRCTSGGSSGGSAALVAAGVCDLAIGTDTGGSIRVPAAYCGIVGLKPTFGAVPLEGVFPLAATCDHVGTLTATVQDAADLLSALSSRPAERQAAQLTIGFLRAQLDDDAVTGEVRDAVGDAVGVLAAGGWRIRELTAPWLDELAFWEDVLAVIVAAEASRVHRGRDTSRYAEGTRALLAFGATVSDDRYAWALEQRDRLAGQINASLEDCDVLAGPTVPYTAPADDPPFGVGESNAEGRFTGPYNLSGHPAISIPVPVSGLPAGLQLAGRRDDDWTLLDAAALIEKGLQTHAA